MIHRAIVLSLALVFAAAVKAERPNIIFFLSDDHRADFLGCAGHPIVKTPTIDRMAKEGVRFENMFVTTSICAASRATIFTGMWERSHRYTFRTPPLDAKYVANSYPTVLRKEGYRTGFIGKFGVGAQGRESMFDFYKPINRGPYFKKRPDGSVRHTTELCGDEAIKFLDGCKKDQPFCLSVSFNAAHAEDGDKVNHFPWPKAEDGLYEDIDIPAARLSDPKVFDSQPDFLKKSMNRQRYFWRWDTPTKYARNVRAYYRMITGLDRVMGRVLDELKKRGIADNTVVIFMGDNGYYKASRGFAGKWSHYEESLRVPLVIFDPRVDKSKRGKVAKQMVLNTDIASTIVDYAGLKIPSQYQGSSLRPIMNGKSPQWRTDFFCEHLMDYSTIPKWEGVRDQRYVYARYFEQKPGYEFLHDLKTDPDQLKNLAGDSSSAGLLKKMRARCDELRDQYGGPYKKWPLAQKKPKKKK